MTKVSKLKSDFTKATSDEGGRKSPLSKIEDIIEDARNGRVFILVDDQRYAMPLDESESKLELQDD